MNRREILAISLLLFLFMSVTAFCGEISLSSKIDNVDIAFEDEVHLEVQVKWIGDITAYSFTILPLPETENLKVAGSSSSISTANEDGSEITTRTFKYTFEPTVAGTGLIHPIVYKYISYPDSLPGELTTQEFKVLIAQPVKVETDSGISIYTLILIFGGIIVVVGLIGFFIVKKTRPQAEPVIPPEQKILEELETLKKEHHADRRVFFTGLHRLLIVYVETKYNLALTGKTNSVVISEINALDIDLNRKEMITGLLEKIETEKFAPTKGEPGDVLRLCTELENHFKKIKE